MSEQTHDSSASKRLGGKPVLYLVILFVSVVAPHVFPALQTQMSFLWVMIIFALCWDVMGGQMGYNSFGNIAFFGVGMYTTAVLQVGLFYDVAEYNDAQGAAGFALSAGEYYLGLGTGLLVAIGLAVLVAIIFGYAMLGLRGHYFAIGTLGLGIAGGELAAAWEFLGAGSGMVTPLFPEEAPFERPTFFYYLCFIWAVCTFFTFKRLYSGRFGIAINAIRDDEDKAEAMGIHTTRYKTTAWCVSAFFLGATGGLVGNIVGFIDPIYVAFAGVTYGVWMVLMAILGGKGTLWGPVIGAVVFHITQELFWTYLLGWQRVALGLLIVLIVVFFPRGIVGFVREKFPELFGIKVDTSMTRQSQEGGQ